MSNLIIPAAPGFYVLDFWGGDDECPQTVDKIPVIGWLVDDVIGSAEAINGCPIVPAGIYYKHQRDILSPNGEVTDGCECSWSYEDWIGMKTREHKEAKSKVRSIKKQQDLGD